MFKSLYIRLHIRALLYWTRKRVETWDAKRKRCGHLSQINYCDGRIESYKDIERILEILINEQS